MRLTGKQTIRWVSKTTDPPRVRREQGSAVIIIIVLLGIMVTFTVGNTLLLRGLKQELRLIERKQLKKYDAMPHVQPVTNDVVATGDRGSSPGGADPSEPDTN